MKQRINEMREELVAHLKVQHTPESAETCYQEMPVRISRNLNWVLSKQNFGVTAVLGS
jgi:hypothetical protein